MLPDRPYRRQVILQKIIHIGLHHVIEHIRSKHLTRKSHQDHHLLPAERTCQRIINMISNITMTSCNTAAKIENLSFLYRQLKLLRPFACIDDLFAEESST